MTLSIDDLVRVYNEAYWHGEKLPKDTADHAGMRAALTVLRDKMARSEFPYRLVNEILAPRGDEAAGGSTREDEKAVEAVGDKGPVSVSSPATDLYFEHIRNHFGPPATDAAPAVCEWTRLSGGRHHVACVKYTGPVSKKWLRKMVCPECSHPIKFVEAAR